VVRYKTSRSGAVIILLTLGLAVPLAMVGCGGSSSTSSSMSTTTPPPTTGAGNVAACVDGTVATYVGTSCSQEDATVYKWTGYSCNSTPPSICANLGTNGANIQMKMDTSSPAAANTILVGQTALWNVTAGQSVDVVITGTVYGAKSSLNWPHFNGLAGQTGDGTEENITTVTCGSSCLNAKEGVSDILCSSSSPIANCTDEHTIDPYEPYQATFTPATSANPYPMTIEIKLNGNSGSATLFSVGTHLTPP
jgi:hypothetical protein